DASGDAAGQTGGAVQIFGDTVIVGDNALIDARGNAGGGTIHVGGGWQGATIDGHASSVRAGVSASATLDASATDSGDGGEIVLWSDVNNTASMTLAHGSFYARGGANGGDGGRIETSGRNLVTTGVRGSASARRGAAGTWLFDPYNVEIVAAGSAGNGPNIVNPGFELGSTGWSPFNGGVAQIVTSVSASNGTFVSPVSDGGNFALVSAGVQNIPTGIQQSFIGTEGQSFDLSAIFVGREGCCFYNDIGGVSLVQPNGQTIQLFYRDVASVSGPNASGFVTSTVNLSLSGTYTLMGYATNVNDSVVSSQLGFELASSSGTSSANGAFGSINGTQVWTPTGTASKIDVGQITGFLNDGTNVQITTGTSDVGNEAGNITVSAAINKTAGGDAALQLDAINAITVNQSIGAQAGALNVILNAGAGGIALNAAIQTNAGDLTLNTSGAVSQLAAFTADGLTLNGAGGSYDLTHIENSFNTLAANTGTVALFNSAALTTLAGVTIGNGLTLNSLGTLQIDGALTVGGESFLGAESEIRLGGAAQITANASMILAAGTNFINEAGADAIAMGEGASWLIYSQAPETNVFGGLASGNHAVWGGDLETAPSENLEHSGNRYIFAATPVVTITALDASKTYGQSGPSREGGGTIGDFSTTDAPPAPTTSPGVQLAY
ncbi:MAG: hypothetical protein M3Q15_07595, partial [Pseudomonadota bacterium]|nr:hypothetical protein [Pseudomonadota bacterium]